jgi:hypothetical protein
MAFRSFHFGFEFSRESDFYEKIGVFFAWGTVIGPPSFGAFHFAGFVGNCCILTEFNDGPADGHLISR